MAQNLPQEEKHLTNDQNRLKKLQAHHKKTLWVYWSLLLIGLWLIFSPMSFGYLNPSLWVDPSGGRGAWWSAETHTELRAWLMTWSDILSGLLLLIFGWRSLSPGRPVSLWICCGVGVWLTMAPVLFWSPVAAAYYNNTLVGALIIALTILIPGMPNMIRYMEMGPSNPEGWSYNPSSWPQRWIMIGLAFVGWLVSRYLSAYQLGYIDSVWDPFFGFSTGTQRVLDSEMSHMWPISDAGLGAIAFTFEFLMGWMGSSARWRTMPWMVAFFGILVIPLGLIHISLVISQPLVVGQWCTMCLLAAAIMLPMIPLQFDEVFAMLQHLKQAKARGDRNGSMWTVFWKGGSSEGSVDDLRSPEIAELPVRPAQIFNSSIWGLSFPWTLTVASLCGLLTMFLPLILSVPSSLANVFYFGGALVITISVVAMGELIRLFRYLNILIALFISLAPFFVEQASEVTRLVATLLGLIILVSSIPRGVVKEKYGTWQYLVR